MTLEARSSHASGGGVESNLFTSPGGGFHTQFVKQAEACLTYTTLSPRTLKVTALYYKGNDNNKH